MEYTYLPIENTPCFILRTGIFVFIVDSSEPLHNKMFNDFKQASNIERFISLLNADPNTAFDIYNNGN